MGFCWDAVALRGVQQEASVVQSSLEACKEGLRGLVGAANRPVVEGEGCLVQGMFMASAEVALYSLFCSGFLFWAEQDKTGVRAAQVTGPGHPRRHSSDFTKKAGPDNVVGRALPSPRSEGVLLRRCPC